MKSVANEGPSAFGAEVRQYRVARGWSQEVLAEAAGVSSGYVSQVESGVRGWRPKKDQVIRLAQALHAPLAHWLELTGHIVPGDSLAPAPRPSFIEFVNGDPSLTEAQKATLRNLYTTWVPPDSPKGNTRRGRRK